MGDRVDLSRGEFTRRYRTSLKRMRPRISPKAGKQQANLFRHDFCVFVSIPFDAKKKDRNRVLRKAINRIYKELTGEQGGPGTSYVDVFSMPRTGSFRYDIPKYLRDSNYCVADVTDMGRDSGLSPGVFFEIGLAVGVRKPFAMFYNTQYAERNFDVDRLPRYLRGQTVLIWGEGQKTSFYEAYRPVHETLVAQSGKWEHPFNEDSGSKGGESSNPIAYLSFQPRNQKAEEWIAERIARTFPRMQLITPRDFASDDGARLVETVAKAELAVIDCTGGINEYALELGVAAALRPDHVIEVWNNRVDSRLNPIAMFPGSRFAWTERGNIDEEDIDRLLEDIARRTQLGRLMRK